MRATSLHCYRFEDTFNKNGRRYIIVCTTKSDAVKIAKQIVARRAMRYAGLAKRALGFLMFKTNTKKVNDGLLNPAVEALADHTTHKTETVQRNEVGGLYRLTLTDMLDYALDAIKGG